MDQKILKIIATKEDLKELVTNKEWTEYKDESLTRMDKMITILDNIIGSRRL